MKKVLRICSFVLAIIMLFILSIPAAAAQEAVNHNIELCGEDLENGDAYVYLMKNGIKIKSAYISREDNEITYTNHMTGESSVENYEEEIQISQSAASEYYRYEGAIVYNLLGPNPYPPTRTIGCSYTSNCDTGRENLNGTYHDILHFASFIATVLGATIATANAIAGQFLSQLGLALDSTDFLIPDKWVTYVKTYVTWKLQDEAVPAMSRLLEGSKFDYVFEGEHYSDQTATYWDILSFQDHDVEFGFYVYNYLYNSGSSVGIREWRDA